MRLPNLNIDGPRAQADDRAAIQAAIEDAYNAGDGIVYIPLQWSCHCRGASAVRA